MSTVKAVNIQHPNAATPAIVLDAAGGLTVSGSSPGGRNLVHNGAMQVAQRGTSVASITASGYYTADRWADDPSSSTGTWTQSVVAEGPTGSGLTKSLKLLCTTANAAPAAGAYHIFQQSLEGQDVQRVAKGTASAKTLTLSFWVKANVTGTYVCQLEDVDNSRHVSAAYTVSASATWEYKTITFPADTTGALNNDNGASLVAEFWLAAGTNFTSGALATAWAATTSANRAVGQVNVAAAINNYWQVTGIQLETGSVATPFEFEDYGSTLRKCQRYYTRFNAEAANAIFGLGECFTTTAGYAYIALPVEMRGIPGLADASAGSTFFASRAGANIAGTSVSLQAATKKAVSVNIAVASGFTAGQAFRFTDAGSNNSYLGFSADL
jgi:hypothetical protein